MRLRRESDALVGAARYWWVWLAVGIIWVFVSVAILQFDQASVTTVGLLVGLMFFGTGVQQLAVASMLEETRWLYIIFGVLFIGAGILSLISPEDTFVALADMLGFLFMIVGVFWILQAFAVRELSEMWWLGLLAGILMVVLAFWTGGQFFIDREYLLLVFAGIWAMMHGVTDVVRAFQIRKLGKLI